MVKKCEHCLSGEIAAGMLQRQQPPTEGYSYCVHPATATTTPSSQRCQPSHSSHHRDLKCSFQWRAKQYKSTNSFDLVNIFSKYEFNLIVIIRAATFSYKALKNTCESYKCSNEKFGFLDLQDFFPSFPLRESSQSMETNVDCHCTS